MVFELHLPKINKKVFELYGDHKLFRFVHTRMPQKDGDSPFHSKSD